MKKLLIGSLLIIGANSAFGGIVKETTTVIGNAKDVHFQRYESYEMPNSTLKFVQPGARTHDYRGYVNKNIYLASEHSFMIQNFTPKKQRYHFKYEITCDGQGASHEGDVDVNGNTTWLDKAGLSFVTNKNHEGVYTIQADTRVKGESSGYTFDRGTLLIRK